MVADTYSFMNASITMRLSALGTPELKANGSADTVAGSAVSDEALISGIAAGDQEALALLFRRYARQVRGVAYRVLRDPSEADDVLQEVFLLIHRKCATFDAAKSPARFWILQVTYRCAISRRRYLASRHFYTCVDLEDVALEGLSAATATEPYAELIDGLRGDGGLKKAFRELSGNQRQTLELHFVEGYTFVEIAARLGQSVGNVRHHYFRGLEKLRKRIFDGQRCVQGKGKGDGAV